MPKLPTLFSPMSWVTLLAGVVVGVAIGYGWHWATTFFFCGVPVHTPPW